jgi:hypothetical protein
VEKIVPKFDKVQNKLVPKKVTTMCVTLSADRKAVPDFVAGQFLQTFQQYIQNPALLAV